MRKGDAIGISGDRSFGLVTTILAVLLAGGVMVPIDPMLPRLRRRVMIETAQVRSMLWVGPTDSEECREYEQMGLPIFCLGPDGEWQSEGVALDGPTLSHKPDPDDPAYVFFTSGTTGVPKGVLGCHKGISHFVNWQRETFAIGPQDRVSQLTSLSFDVLLRDLFLPLTSGATLCLPEEKDLYQVPLWLERAGVTVLHAVPSLVQTWLRDAVLPSALPSLRWVFIAGEPLTDALIRRWHGAFSNAGRLVNLYGPTETTMSKCYFVIPDNPTPGVQPVGRPLPETQLLVLGPAGCLCGVGELGEIVVRSPYRTLGYLNRDSKVGAGFVPNPFRGDVKDLVYYSGDRGRYRSDGLLEILGRLDDQVKIRGVRVEPAEVTLVLAQHPLVDACTVVSLVDRSRHDEAYLAAYVVPAAPNAVDMETLRAFLRERLHAAMVPVTFTLLDALPLTASGKVDRKALPVADPKTVRPSSPKVAPRTALEYALAQIWCEVLKRGDLSVDDDFFVLGGHSLLVTQIVVRINRQFQVDLPIRSVFEAPTVARLASLLEQLHPLMPNDQAGGISRISRTCRSLRSQRRPMRG